MEENMEWLECLGLFWAFWKVSAGSVSSAGKRRWVGFNNMDLVEEGPLCVARTADAKIPRQGRTWCIPEISGRTVWQYGPQRVKGRGAWDEPWEWEGPDHPPTLCLVDLEAWSLFLGEPLKILKDFEGERGWWDWHLKQHSGHDGQGHKKGTRALSRGNSEKSGNYDEMMETSWPQMRVVWKYKTKLDVKHTVETETGQACWDRLTPREGDLCPENSHGQRPSNPQSPEDEAHARGVGAEARLHLNDW